MGICFLQGTLTLAHLLTNHVAGKVEIMKEKINKTVTPYVTKVSTAKQINTEKTQKQKHR